MVDFGWLFDAAAWVDYPEILYFNDGLGIRAGIVGLCGNHGWQYTYRLVTMQPGCTFVTGEAQLRNMLPFTEL